MNPIRLAVVDDSAFVRKALQRVFESEPGVQVVGMAASGEELLERLDEWNPDVVTLDLSMPGIGGLATLDRILEWRRIPVVILSTHSAKDAPLTIESLHRGAADFVDKQEISLVDFAALRSVLLEKIEPLVGKARARPRPSPPPPPRPAPPPPASIATTGEGSGDFVGLVIGASTGGPPAIQDVLSDIAGAAPVPIAIVQHMPAGFTKPFADRLNAHLQLPVREATHGETLVPGTAYIAPAGSHLRIRRDGERYQAVLARFPEDVSHRPSVDVLFESAAETWGRGTLAVLLTGMGRDGADGMAKLFSAGAWTIAQDEATSTVYGMPRAAWELGAVREIHPLWRIGERIRTLLAEGRPRRVG